MFLDKLTNYGSPIIINSNHIIKITCGSTYFNEDFGISTVDLTMIDGTTVTIEGTLHELYEDLTNYEKS